MSSAGSPVTVQRAELVITASPSTAAGTLAGGDRGTGFAGGARAESQGHIDRTAIWRIRVNRGLTRVSAPQDFSAPSISPLKNSFWAKAKAMMPGVTTMM